MAPQLSNGKIVAQILAYESDIARLLQNIQMHVAAGNALYAAIFLCRYSGQSAAIEKRAIIAAHHPQYDQFAGARAESTAHHDHDQDHDLSSGLSGDLTLTLVHIDTTWRFEDINHSSAASPKFSWPIIRKFYTPGAHLDTDLVLEDHHLSTQSRLLPRKRDPSCRMPKWRLTRSE